MLPELQRETPSSAAISNKTPDAFQNKNLWNEDAIPEDCQKAENESPARRESSQKQQCDSFELINKLRYEKLNQQIKMA